jgi:ssDNA-binding Zn-finger/Zn-ribbon topoisomerase 1
MNNLNEKCVECGEVLKSSQFGLTKKEGEDAAKEINHLVCRNYPTCSKAEKE